MLRIRDKVILKHSALAGQEATVVGVRTTLTVVDQEGGELEAGKPAHWSNSYSEIQLQVSGSPPLSWISSTVYE